jgi:hypothetical protein
MGTVHPSRDKQAHRANLRFGLPNLSTILSPYLRIPSRG